ncbi:MAG: CARDB domain-containing protein [Candidatus Bathyarchaeia archaeon]
MSVLRKTVALLLFLLICANLFTVIAEVKPSTVTTEPEDSGSPLLDDTIVYNPIIPPEPRTVAEAENHIEMAGFNVLTGEEVVVPSTDPSQSPVAVGVTTTPPYEGLSPVVMPETVFPPDDRSLVSYSTTVSYPWRTICKLYITAADGTGWIGSGSIVGPGQGGHGYHLLTAGHCVYMHDHGGWISSMQVIPGYDGAQDQAFEQTPYYSAWVTYMRTYTGWTDYADHRHDWAVCTLDRCVGDYTGWMGRITADPSNSIYTGILNTAGYPGDKDSGERMYFDSDYGRTANEYNHWYYMDTFGGQSGSPVWYYDGSSRYTATVHAYSDDGSGSNHGTRLNQDKFDRISTWLSSDTPPTDKADLTDEGQSWSGFSPTTVTAGATSFNVWSDVRNFGTASSGGFYVAYYASTNTVISPSDYLIGTDYVSSIAPFAYADSDWTGVFPSSVPAGTYWVGWIIDSTGAVSEFDEGNNIAYKNSYQLTVKPKRTITFYTDPTTIGSITFAGTTYTNGQTGQYADGTYSVTANAPSGWTFSNWVTTGGVSVSGSTATVTGAGSIKAVFTQIKYTITFYTDPTNVGSITFSGTAYTNGQTGQYAAGAYSVAANAPAGWVFNKWVTTGGVSISGSTATVTGAGTIKAVFKSYFEIWTDKTTYKIGDTMKVYVHVRNPGAALPARAIIKLTLPDGSQYGPLLNMVVTIPAGYDSGDVLWNQFTIPSVPLGTYAWVAELRNPTTNALISQRIWNWALTT